MAVTNPSPTSSRALTSLSKTVEELRAGDTLCSESKVICAKSPFLWTSLYIVFFGKRTIYWLLLFFYMFSVNIGLIVGEPQIMYNNASSTFKLDAFSQSSSTSRLHRKPFFNGADQSGSIGGSDENAEFVIQRTTPDPGQFLQTYIMHHFENQSNVIKATPVIASSFRTIDSQTTTNSKEEGGGKKSSPEEPTPKKKTKKCQPNALKKCIDGLPPMNDTGLPTSPEAVERACRIYDSGITCFDTWAKNCLPNDHRQRVKQSITGAHEMYSFLCKDLKFRSDYLKHKDCYKQLSPYWDDCSRQFIESLGKTKNNHTVFCCIRLEFVGCVSKYSSRLCSLEATIFSLKMAETLIRTQTRTTAEECNHIQSKQCIPIFYNGTAHSVSQMANLASFLLVFIVMGLDWL